MGKDPTEILKMIHRIKTGPEGPEFMEYLETLSLDNYLAFKRCDPAQSELHKGYALGIDNIISMFEECDIAIKEDKEIVPDWTN